MEMDEKYWLVDWSSTILDIWCAPWSWLQYISIKLSKDTPDPSRNKKKVVFDALPVQDEKGVDNSTYWLDEKKILWLDLKKIDLTFPWVETYVQDITERENVERIFDAHEIDMFDLIVSDMAPDTIWISDIDALRSIWLIEKTFWIFEKHLVENWQFVIKVFMWPWFDELVRDLKNTYWSSNIVMYKPKACRPKSKEMYIIKRY